MILLPVALFAAEGSTAADLVTDGQSIDLTSERYQALFAELRAEHNFSQEELATIFSGLTIKKRVLVLMDSQWEAKPYFEYYPRFITSAVIKEGKEKLVQHKAILDRVEKELGVDREVVVAIWAIETRFGSNTGGFDMLQTLNTLFDAYPRRSSFYRKQLIHFLLLCRENNVDPKTVDGSYGGAFGQTQFIPSSFREYAVDFDHDGRRDVWNSIDDILASIANYLKRYGWVYDAPLYAEIGPTLKGSTLKKAYEKGRKGRVGLAAVEKAQGLKLPASPANKELSIVGLELDEEGAMRYVAGYPNFQAITAWNHSNRYAMAVCELSEYLAGVK
ncbi:MAG: lytic murein transglycosylase [Proteobacteria bacterium]|nr:lytic murein transglycosylase [Pseudomonadota bacterium]MBU1638917.1 lytic murein transglycosylase [Pseudomonadota bacterium]